MFRCPDPAVNFLKSYGYNVIRLPREGFAPLTILGLEGRDLNTIGSLSSVLTSADPLPPTASVQAAHINGKKSSSLKVDVGLSILSGVISALGGSTLGLKLGYKNAAKIQFEFANVLSDAIERAKLDLFLSKATLSGGPAVSKLFEADKVYVVTSVLRSKKFLVDATKEDGKSIEVNLPVIEESIGAEVKVALTGETAGKTSYEGNSPLSFAFQAVQLVYKDGVYQSYRDLDDPNIGAKSMKLGEATFNAEEAALAGLFRTEAPFAPLR